MNFLRTMIISLLFLIVFPAYAGAPDGSVYLDGKATKVGVILSHGRGGGPKSHVVDPLRRAINQELGFHTLSLQLPNKRNNWDEYDVDFPDAHKIIAEGVQFLRKERGVETVYLMGYSMGGRMASAYLWQHPDPGIDGFIGVGLRGKGTGGILDSLVNLQEARPLPIFDVWGTGGDGKDATHAEQRAILKYKHDYTTHVIQGAPHSYSGSEGELTDAVVAWLKARH